MNTTQTTTNASAPGALPATSLIICSRNRPHLLAETVESILRGDQVPAEIIVVDQSDAPHQALAALTSDRGCDVRYLWTRTVGLSRANNQGVAAARHALLVFTHDDVLVTPTWFGAIVEALRAAGPRSVVTGQVRPTEAETRGGFQLALKVDQAPAVYTGRMGRDVLYPLNMAMYRSAIDEVGRFDERLGPGTPFPGSEDSDLGFRLLETGYRICYVPEAALYHRAWRPERDYLPLRWSYGVARGGFYAKYLSLRDRHMLSRMAADVRTHFVLFLYRVRRERRQAYGDVVLGAGILFGAIRWLLTQRKETTP